MRIRIKKNVPLAKEETPRKEWPFGEMKVGDVIDFHDAKEWPIISKYALTYARKKTPRWKFKVTWIESQNVGRVRRIS